MTFTERNTGKYYSPSKFLDREEELRLFRAWRENGDADAHSRLCESIMPYAQKLAIKFCERRHWSDTNAAISAAYLGVVDAVRKFRPSKKCRLTTYATWWITQKLHRDMAY